MSQQLQLLWGSQKVLVCYMWKSNRPFWERICELCSLGAQLSVAWEGTRTLVEPRQLAAFPRCLLGDVEFGL